MSNAFDGVAGLLNGIFGKPVTVTPALGGSPRTVRGVFRREPIEVAGEDGFPVLVLSPTLKVPATEDLKRGDIVEPSVEPGSRYEVMNGEPSPSPASDRFVIYELEVAE
jgi:hypothetical protein